MKSIQKKIGLFTTALILATAILITAFVLIIFNQSMTTQLEEDVRALSASYSQAVHNKIESFKRVLELSATLEGITQADAAQRDALLAHLAERSGYKYFAIADSTGQTSRNSDISQREYFQKAMAGETYMSSPLVNMVDGSITIMVATPIDNGTGYNGVLYGGIPYDVFSQIISNIKIGEGGYGFVVDKTGVIVAHPEISLVENMMNFIDAAKENEEYASVAKAIGRMIKGETGIEYTYYEGLQRLYGFSPVEGPEQWSINVTVPTEQIKESIYRTILYCLIVAAVLVVVSIVSALLFSRALTKPIVTATRRIELLSEGNLNAQIPAIKGRDEIARLNTALKNTVENLQSYIGDLAETLNSMAHNDFSQTTKAEYKGDFIQIRDSVNNIVDSMSSVLSTINTSAEQVAAGSNLVSNSSFAQSQGATEQASAVQELSASLEEIAAQTSKNAENAKSANSLVKNARINAENGNGKMSDMLAAMEDINTSSDSIKRIIKVIDDIAFQTNILALNAAVEAARAGQHGKGFAVVAEEVRTLAARSAQAARETTDLIENSLKNVEAGTKIARETAASLASIVEEVAKAADLVDSISASSEEQAVGVEQIRQGIMQVSTVVQSTAATSEESAAASEELSSQAAQLKEIVGSFKYISTGDQTAAPLSASTAKAALSAAKTAKNRITLGDESFGKY